LEADPRDLTGRSTGDIIFAKGTLSMHKTKIFFAAGLTALLLAGAAEAAPSRFQFGLSFSPSLPQGEFNDELGKTIWGGTLFFAYRPSELPFQIGTSLAFGVYDTDYREAWLGLTWPDVLVDVRTTNAVLAWYVFMRFQAERGWLRPYVDIFAGLHILSTDTRIGDGDWDDDGSGDFSVNNASDAAFAFGAGAGILFPIVRFVRRDGATFAAIELDLGVRYAKGGRAHYLVENDGWGLYDSRNSRTDLLTLSAGLTFSF